LNDVEKKDKSKLKQISSILANIQSDFSDNYFEIKI
jgi:hypothetical protein